MRSGLQDLNLLKIFAVVFDEGSISLAAARLGLSQPAVSGAIRRLSEQIGEPLFERAPGGVRPTARAQKLIGPVRDSLHAFGTALGAMDDAPEIETSRAFRVAMFNLIEPVFLPHVVSALQTGAPNVTLNIIPIFAVDPMAGLVNGTLDLVFNTNALDHPDLISTDFPTAKSVCLTRKGWTDRNGPLDEGGFKAAQKVKLSFGNTPPEPKAIASIAPPKANENIVLTLNKGWSIPCAVAAGDLVALVPAGFARVVAGRFGLEIHPAPIDLPRPELYLSWHRRVEDDPLHKRLLGYFRESMEKFAATAPPLPDQLKS